MKKQELVEIVEREVMGRRDIAFTHSVLCQCFFPLRRRSGRNFWKCENGKASLILQPGWVVDPSNPGHWNKYEIPYGAKARLLFTYIHNEAIRRKSRELDMGISMRNFMIRAGIQAGGKNGQELLRQVHNVISTKVTLGVWGDGKVEQRDMMFVDRAFFEKKVVQRGEVWLPDIVLSKEYYQALSEHQTPVDFRALVGLQRNPRAMDVYQWLSYRLYVLRRATRIPYEALHEIMGQDIKNLRNFKVEFKQAILEAVRFYPEAKVDYQNNNDFITIYPSKAPLKTDRNVVLNAVVKQKGRGKKGHFLR